MLEYRVRGRNAATAATADNGVGILWNPSTTVPLWIVEVHLTNTTAASNAVELARTSTRGTAGSTVTPDIDSHVDRLLAPTSGALLDLADFSAEPTVGTPSLGGHTTPATIGAGKVWNFRGGPIRVLPGAGFGIITADAAAVAACEIEFAWWE